MNTLGKQKCMQPELPVGYLLDELKNDITHETPTRPVRELLGVVHRIIASALSRGKFLAGIDYVVARIPRFAFEVLAHGHHSASHLDAQHADEKRRRSDGDWPHVQEKPAKMPAVASPRSLT